MARRYHNAVMPWDLLQGITARVVSLPCWELFEKQDAAYCAAVLPQGPAKVSVEAARSSYAVALAGWNCDCVCSIGRNALPFAAAGD